MKLAAFGMLFGGGGLALAMLHTAFVSLQALSPGGQINTFLLAELGFAGFFFGLYVLMREWLRQPSSGPAWWRHPAAYATIGGNLVVLAGVWFGGWPAFPLLVLFWLETAILALLVGIRMVQKAGLAAVVMPAAIFLFPWLIYGVFIFVMFGLEPMHDLEIEPGPGALLAVIREFHLVGPMLALCGCHVAAFLLVVSRAPASPGGMTDAEAAFAGAPATRMLLLHVFLIAGGSIADELGSPTIPLLVLIACKMLIELGMQAALLSRMDKLAAAKVDLQAPAPVHHDDPLAGYLGRWMLPPGAPAAPGWFQGVLLALTGGTLRAHVTGTAGFTDDVHVRRAGDAIQCVEVKLSIAGHVRLLRFQAAGDAMHLTEFHYLEDNPAAVQEMAFSLRRA